MAAADGLYRGTAGIGLFLGELWGCTREPAALACARGALRHARRMRETLRLPRLGLYSGDVGIAYVAARIAAITQEQEWADVARWHLRDLEGRVSADGPVDVIGGAAGAILGLLEIERILGDPRFLTMALRLGERLAHSATRRAFGWSWRSADGSAQDLCGYAHGVSGMAHALLELYARTGDGTWRFAASRAMAYERRHALAQTGDWPDFRRAEVMNVLRNGQSGSLRDRLRLCDPTVGNPPSTMRAWCHGAPGIALTRIRAVTLGVDAEECQVEAQAALGATMETLEDPVRTDYSLCHGIFGNAEPVATAERHLCFDGEAVRRTAEDAIHAFDLAGKPWPAGTPSSLPDPSLMLGDAGIGHFLLRCVDQNIPSALFVSHWSVPKIPDTSGDADLIRAEVARLMPWTTIALQNLSGVEAIREDVEQRTRCARFSDALRAVQECAAASHEVGGQLLRDAAALDNALLEEEFANDDFVSNLVRELRRLQIDEVEVSTARFVRSPHARMLTTRWCWAEWSRAPGTLPPERAGEFVLYRDGRDVKLQAVTATAAVVLRAFDRPNSIRDAVKEIARSVDWEASALEELPQFVDEVVREAVAADFLEAQQGGP